VALVVADFGEAATAVNNAAVHLEPELTLIPGHSTDDDLAPPRTRTRTGSIPVVRAPGGQA
jgi:thioredoxin reductase (NADPH)